MTTKDNVNYETYQESNYDDHYSQPKNDASGENEMYYGYSERYHFLVNKKK